MSDTEQKPWEDLVSLNSSAPLVLHHVGSAADHRNGPLQNVTWDWDRLPLDDAIANDPNPIPDTKNRESYYGQHHLAYWASGLQAFQFLTDCVHEHGAGLKSYLDFGCASGRVLRHFAYQADGIEVYGSDINRKHTDWINRFLPFVIAFQSHSLPHLPFADNTFDLVSAFSVFTHIETWDMAWMLELRRILRPGGIAWITFHSEHTWSVMKEGWPLYADMKKFKDFEQLRGKPLPDDFTVFRHKTDRSYSSNVFLTTDYVKRSWGSVFEIVEIKRQFPTFQDVAIMRKHA